MFIACESTLSVRNHKPKLRIWEGMGMTPSVKILTSKHSAKKMHAINSFHISERGVQKYITSFICLINIMKLFSMVNMQQRMSPTLFSASNLLNIPK